MLCIADIICELRAECLTVNLTYGQFLLYEKGKVLTSVTLSKERVFSC